MGTTTFPRFVQNTCSSRQTPESASVETLVPDSRKWDVDHSWHPFTQTKEHLETPPASIVRGEGCWLFDEAGERFLDGYASTWTNVHGHNVEDLNDALVGQLGRIAHSTYLGLAHDPGSRLAKRLADLAPGNLDRVFYSDNGSGAVEVALKLSLRYWQLVGKPERSLIVAMENAYHGDTFGAMSVGGDGPFTNPWRPQCLPVRRFVAPACVERNGKVLTSCDTTSLASLGRILKEEEGKVVAVILEPSVQGAAGMSQQPPGFLQKVETLCREAGIHLILDEVFVAFGRLGEMLVCSKERICPDFLCLAKGLTAGYLPLAATLATNKIFDAFTGAFHEHKTFYHGHTFTANPLAASVALKSAELLEESIDSGRVGHAVESFGQLVEDHFGDHPRIREIRQRGLSCCLDLCPERAPNESFPPERRFAREVCIKARERGVLLRPLGESLPLVPPISIAEDELAFLCEHTRDALDTTPA